MCADRFIPRTQSIQGHEVSSNNQTHQSVNQTGKEAHKLIPNWAKNSNIGRQKTVVHLCAEVPHELPEGRRSKPIKLLLSSVCKYPIQQVGKSKRLPVAYTGTPADIRITIKHFCIYFHYVPMTYRELRKRIGQILFCNT